MAKTSKRMKTASEHIDRNAAFGIKEAVGLVKNNATAKFDESVDLALKLGVDPRKADQMIRGICALPHGTGKTVRVLAVAKGPKATEAEEAGADLVMGEEVVEKIKEGWMDFDRLVATPDMMGQIGKVGKILGPRGLMPNPKSGTVTMDIGAAVKNIKAGQVAFRVDKTGIVHVPVGRASFAEEKLVENISTMVDTIRKMRPPTTKGMYMISITLNTTMGPGVRLDPQSLT